MSASSRIVPGELATLLTMPLLRYGRVPLKRHLSPLTQWPPRIIAQFARRRPATRGRAPDFRVSAPRNFLPRRYLPARNTAIFRSPAAFPICENHAVNRERDSRDICSDKVRDFGLSVSFVSHEYLNRRTSPKINAFPVGY